jgi:pimeloyl-ACP methyl ester carboxylesterase
MSRTLLAAALATLLLPAAAPAIAEVSGVSPSGYVVTVKAPIKATPRAVFTAIQQVGQWWEAEHTYSGNAGHMTMEYRAGGCFCERWNGNSIEHARVLYVARDKALRLAGGLGPLQEMAVNAIMDFKLEPRGDDTALTFTYRVRGSADAALDKTARIVDRVLSTQIIRLVRYIETGSPVALAPPEPLRDQFFSSDGVRIRYVEDGRGADPVILVHDRGSSIEAQWIETKIMPTLVSQQIFRVIALDLRGHGRSDQAASAKVDVETARDVVRLLDHLQIPRAHVVGYGLGANIAAYLATVHGDRFITMTLAGGAHVSAAAAGDDRRELAVTDEQMKAVKVPSLGLIGTRDPALRELMQLKAVMPRLARMVSLEDETHGSAPRNPEFVLAIQYFLRYHPARLVN